MIRLLAESPLLLLFVVSALGFLVGRIRLGGFHLGVAAVLFVGLGVGALDPALTLPEFVTVFGLALFVYTVGLTSGPGYKPVTRQVIPPPGDGSRATRTISATGSTRRPTRP